MTEQKSGKLLNPFAFPSETQLRSILLIWAILSLCWLVGFSFAKAFLKVRGWPTVGELPRLDHTFLLYEETSKSPTSPDDIRAWSRRMGPAYPDLKKPGGPTRTLAALADLSNTADFHLKVIFPYLVIPSFFLILVIFFILTQYAFRAGRLWLSRVPSRSGETPDFKNILRSLIQETQELQKQHGENQIPHPRFLFSRGAKTDGQAFGTSTHPFILLTQATRCLLKKDIRQQGKPYLLRAMVFHELAHLANRDVTRSCWAEACRGVLVPVLILLLATLWLLRSPLEALEWLWTGIHMMAILSVIELVRRGILRGREHEADLRTALLWNAGAPLGALFAMHSIHPSSSSMFWQRLTRLWRKHPTAAERQDVLDHPRRALELNLEIPFLAGILFGNLIGSSLVLASVALLAMSAVQTLMTNSIIAELVPFLGSAGALKLYPLVGLFFWGAVMSVSAFALLGFISYLLAGTLGAQVQRESMLQIVEADRYPHPYRTLLKPAFLTTSGFAIGLMLVPMAPTLPKEPGEFLSLTAWVLGATLSFWGWLSVIRLLTRRLLGAHMAHQKPVRKLRIVTWGSAVLLWPLVLILLGSQFWLWPNLPEARFMVLAAAGLLGFFLLLILLALAIREVRREERRPLCPHPHCRSEVSTESIAADCAACGKSLAPWLFLQGTVNLGGG